MIRVAVIDGQKVRIDHSQVLGVGGEATVVRDNNRAIKIYHKPDADRARKLKDFCSAGFKLPRNICMPQDLVLDSTGRKIVGFTMPLIPSGREVVQELARKSFRKSHPRYNSEFIADLFIHAHKTMESLHQHGIVIGDFNDLNVLFDMTKPLMVFIDVDSYQFGQHPCMVGTEHFLDPCLYGLNLAEKPYFSEQNDWYSFCCMLIKSLIMCHPYGGVHPKVKTLPQRAESRITAFDTGVIYPKAAYSPDLLDDGLMNMIDRVFKKGHRDKPEVEMLEEFRNALTACGSCGVMYPGDKQSCPQCAKINTQQIQRQVKIVKKPGHRTVHSEEILSAVGSFVWHRLVSKSLFAVSLSGNKYTLHQSTQSNPVGEISSDEPLRFGIFGGKYLVTSASDEAINVWDTSAGLKHVVRQTCGSFHGTKTFGCSKNYLFRMKDGWLYKGRVGTGASGITSGMYVEDQVINMMDDQTWFICSPVNDVVFGFQRFFQNYQFFLHRHEEGKSVKFFDVKIPALEQNESILSVSARFDASCVLFLMKTEIKGKTFTRVFVIHQHDGRILSQYCVEALSSDTHKNIHGKAFMRPGKGNGFILHPTDDGVVQEIVGDNAVGSMSLLSETEQFISETDSLLNFRSGILVVGDKLINYLTLS